MALCPRVDKCGGGGRGTAPQRLLSVDRELRTHGHSHLPVIGSLWLPPHEQPVLKVLLTFNVRDAPSAVISPSNDRFRRPPSGAPAPKRLLERRATLASLAIVVRFGWSEASTLCDLDQERLSR